MHCWFSFWQSVTDLLDGFIARITNQVTYFGRILDPVADKFFLITSFVLMSANGFIPEWLTIIVISKDVIVLTGSLIVYLVTSRLKIEPSFMGKITSASQFALVGLILLALKYRRGLTLARITFYLGCCSDRNIRSALRI